jgi:hypothetical protein
MQFSPASCCFPFLTPTQYPILTQAKYDSEKENWRILTNKEIYASKTYYNRDNKVK